MNLDLIFDNVFVQVPLVLSLVQAIKMVIPERQHKWSPLISIGVALILVFITRDPDVDENISYLLTQSLILGLASSGLYSGAKTTIRNNERTID